MIKGQEVFNYIDPRAKYIAKNAYGESAWFTDKPKPLNDIWVAEIKTDNKDMACGILGKIEIEDFQNKDWEKCIIKNRNDPNDWIGYFCYFGVSTFGEYGYLKSYTPDSNKPFQSYDGTTWQQCYPVKKSEIKFYENE